MRFLADENFPGDAVAKLVAAGHDVLWIRTLSPGMTDEAVAALAAEERRIVLTFDKDFGELIWRRGFSGSVGVVLIRTPMPAARHVAARLAALIDGRNDWVGQFSVIEPGRIRMRPLTEL